MRFGAVELGFVTSDRIVVSSCCEVNLAAATTNSFAIVNVWILRACSSCVSCLIVSTGAGDGFDT